MGAAASGWVKESAASGPGLAQDTRTLPAFNLPSGKEPLLIEDCQPA